MELTWKYVKPLNDPTAVKNFLDKYGVSLPITLIEIMEKYNGGRPSEKAIITDTNREYVFKSMLSYNMSDKDTIYSIYPEVFGKTNWFPFASDAAGNFVCYDTQDDEYVLYNHETNKGERIVQMVAII